MKSITSSLLNLKSEIQLNSIPKSESQTLNGFRKNLLENHHNSIKELGNASEFIFNNRTNRLRKLQRENRTLWTTIVRFIRKISLNFFS